MWGYFGEKDFRNVLNQGTGRHPEFLGHKDIVIGQLAPLLGIGPIRISMFLGHYLESIAANTARALERNVVVRDALVEIFGRRGRGCRCLRTLRRARHGDRLGEIAR
jgi:hypothetical protein